ncbi:MAG: hypothetical protein HOV68_01590, partial [Streptomycetaceae bacterium]|nr:hypothetical protein [Streptomycetaceae bacterium]
SVRRRLLALDPVPGGGDFPTRAVTVADLVDLVHRRADDATRRKTLLTDTLPADLDAAVTRTGTDRPRFAAGADEETRDEVEQWLRGEPIVKGKGGAKVRVAPPDRFGATPARINVVQTMYATWPDPAWTRLPEHPWFRTRVGLARFGGHALPYARLAAVEDPAADGRLIGALLHDPSPTLRWWARRDPRLPWPSLRPLIESQPEDAAANPGLPPEVMHRLLDIVHVPG